MAKTKKRPSKGADDAAGKKLRSKGTLAAKIKWQLLSEQSSDAVEATGFRPQFKIKSRKYDGTVVRQAKLGYRIKLNTTGALEANDVHSEGPDAKDDRPLAVRKRADTPADELVEKVVQIGAVLSILPAARDQAMDKLFDLIDAQMKAAEFPKLSAMCGVVAERAGQLPSELLLGLLTATLPARSQLPDRTRLFQATRTRLDELDELEDGLLDGLE